MVIFKPSRKNKDFLFLPDPILVGWLKILHLKKDMVPLFVQAFWDMELLLTYREKQNFVETN